MRFQRIAEPVTGNAEPLGPADAMLDRHPETAERPVVRIRPAKVALLD
jgi:hypothetical protein